MTIDGLIAVLIAPFFGSFLGVVIDRLPEGRPILAGRSACDHCGRHLGPLELIPLISFLWQGGSCKTCGGRLRRFYPAIELAATAVAIGVAVTMSGWLIWVSLYLGWSLLALAVIDNRHKVLPDPINLTLLPVGLAVTFIHSPSEIEAHGLGAVLGFSMLASISFAYRYLKKREGLGLGDAKLFAAAGAWLGWAALPGLLFVAAFSALLLTLIRTRLDDRISTTDHIAFGPYLALAFWGSWLFGPVIFA